jgi:hypothetical protein
MLEQDARAASSSSPIASSQSNSASNHSTQDMDVTADQIHPPQQQRDPIWRHVEHGILTFIASLIPTPPPDNEQVEANAVPVAERIL